MATFMDIHTGMHGLTREQLDEEHRRDLAIEKDLGVRFLKAWGDPESGKVFCLSEGPNKEAVRAVHARAGHPTNEIYELPIEVG